MEIMLKIDEIEEKLPGIDCASCGSPSCACFAQDVAMGNADITDCVFVMKKELKKPMRNAEAKKVVLYTMEGPAGTNCGWGCFGDGIGSGCGQSCGGGCS
jgi:ArsR family metal-binding transcriptional regulator